MTIAPEDKIWREPFTVRAYETDHERLGTIQTICNYFQEAASNHAGKLQVSITQWDRQRLTWVLGRLHIRVDRFPRWQETVTLTTYPSGGNRLYAFRDFEITVGGERLATGTSAWIVLDTQRRRPVRVPPYIMDMQPEGRPRLLADDFKSKLGLPPGPPHRKTFHVRLSDL
ncbi:MAG: hypothetical protein EOM20_19110, partial [Spartobacteria bacterium]|nr:hypothetical protein [Spartobacteria bacterium]